MYCTVTQLKTSDRLLDHEKNEAITNVCVHPFDYGSDSDHGGFSVCDLNYSQAGSSASFPRDC